MIVVYSTANGQELPRIDRCPAGPLRRPSQRKELRQLGPQGMEKFTTKKSVVVTLWLCQNSYWKWWFIVDLPIENGDVP